MKNIGVIPARFASSRLPGKPLADIYNKPMIWWVYQQAIRADGLDTVIVATDDERVSDVCKTYGIEAIMTSVNHKTHIDRVHEISQKVHADLYVCICGDEPLTKSQTIEEVLPHTLQSDYVARALMREIDDPAEALDPSNIKIVANEHGDCLLMTRSMAPFPYKSTPFKYRKLVGIECYSKSALDFFAQQPMGLLERIEDITLLRFVENRKPIQFIKTEAYQVSVDTPADLERVRMIVQRAIEKGEDLH